ncbi:hypothetical protein ASF65_00170 [Aureimonas sp. Leaf324]|jgi:hypothetical protein|nr:hypothetical protein ASF65_00170 [Aureimonas sp. Leaf324]
MDHRIAICALRGLRPDAIADRLELPTEYVERRRPVVYGMPVTAPGVRPTIQNRLLAVLEEADGEPVTLDTLMGVYDIDDEPQIGTIAVTVCRLRKCGHRITYATRYALVGGSMDLAGASVRMRGIMGRLRQGMASRRELSSAAGCRGLHDINVYVHRLRDRGAVIERHATYILHPPKVLS